MSGPLTPLMHRGSQPRGRALRFAPGPLVGNCPPRFGFCLALDRRFPERPQNCVCLPFGFFTPAASLTTGRAVGRTPWNVVLSLCVFLAGRGSGAGTRGRGRGWKGESRRPLGVKSGSGEIWVWDVCFKHNEGWGGC